VTSSNILTTRPLFSVARVTVSTVDKLTVEGEQTVRLCNYTDVYKNSEVYPGLDLMEATATAAEIRQFRLCVGDTVFTKDSETADDIGVAAFVSGTAEDFVCGYHLAVARPIVTEIDPRYLYWWLASQEAAGLWGVRASGVTRVGLRQTDIRRFPLRVVARKEQTGIADFLDRETAQIDALVAEQRELVRLLEERRSSMIWRLVTKGVRQTTMRDSGVRWLGSVPSHWGVHRLKNSVASSKSGVWGDEPSGDGTDVRCVRVADFDRPRLRVHDLDITMRSVESRDLRGRGLCDGDLLLEKSGGTARNPVGFVVMYEGSGPAVCSNFVSRVRVKPEQVARYWLYAHAASYTHRLTQRSVKQTTGIQNLDEGAYFNEPFPYPPHDEQVEIADRLDSSTARMDTMIEAANESIALMLERRAALISAAITGRIDPRTGQEIKEAS
jgi:type I restriction enzyme, S subunit